MAATTGSAGFSSNFHGITSDEVSHPPSLATASTLYIYELASDFSLAADAQTAKITASWSDFTFFMYKAEKYRRDTAETTGSVGFSDNFHGITSDDVSQPLSLATAST